MKLLNTVRYTLYMTRLYDFEPYPKVTPASLQHYATPPANKRKAA